MTFTSTILLSPKQLEDIIRNGFEHNSRAQYRILNFQFKLKDRAQGIGHGKEEWTEFMGAEIEVEITDTTP